MDADVRDGVFQLTLLAKMKLRSPGGSGQDRERVGAGCRAGSPVEDGNQFGEIGTGLETAPVGPGRQALQREGVGDEGLAEFGEGQRIDGHVFFLRALPERRKR